jgi:hypothetical protein
VDEKSAEPGAEGVEPGTPSTADSPRVEPLPAEAAKLPPAFFANPIVKSKVNAFTLAFLALWLTL